MDGLKNSYVIDNTKLIEFEEKTYNLKSLLKDAAKATTAGETFNLKIRNFKLSVCREILQLKMSRRTSMVQGPKLSDAKEQMMSIDKLEKDF